MSTAQERVVRIASADGLRQAAVTEHDFKNRKLVAHGGQTYEDMGYKIVSFEDGVSHDEEPTSHAINRAAVAPEIGTGEVTPESEGTPLPEQASESEPAPTPAPTPRRSRRSADDDDGDSE